MGSNRDVGSVRDDLFVPGITLAAIPLFASAFAQTLSISASPTRRPAGSPCCSRISTVQGCLNGVPAS
jgi:hypothetical protein